MIEVTNLTKQKVRNDLVVKIAEKVLKEEKEKGWDISIVFVGCAKIKELNRKFRGKNFSTDVLSFSGLEIEGSKKRIGEIFICQKEAQTNARKEKKNVEEVLNWIIAHSVLHLLGYDHEKPGREAEKMRQKEEKYI